MKSVVPCFAASLVLGLSFIFSVPSLAAVEIPSDGRSVSGEELDDLEIRMEFVNIQTTKSGDEGLVAVFSGTYAREGWTLSFDGTKPIALTAKRTFKVSREISEGLRFNLVATGPKGETETEAYEIKLPSEVGGLAHPAASPTPDPASGNLPLKLVTYEGGWIAAGPGVNYQQYSQTILSRSDVEFGSFSAPSFMVQGGYRKGIWGGEIAIKDTPGAVRNIKEPFSIGTTTYHWRTISIEGARVLKDSLVGADRQGQWSVRVGLQYHQVPFLKVESNAQVDIVENMLMMATAGAQLDVPVIPNWWAQGLLRYQYPLKTHARDGMEFSITPKFAFDGSVGVIYDPAGRYFIGAFWYGQWHHYSFTYRDSAGSSSGTQSIFYSNLDARLGFRF